jgi:hypothetical protein
VSGRPYDHEQVQEPVVLHLPPGATLEEAEELRRMLERGEQPFVVLTSHRDGVLERAWWWITWHEHLRVRRGVLYLTAMAATWGVVDLLTRVLEAAA